MIIFRRFIGCFTTFTRCQPVWVCLDHTAHTAEQTVTTLAATKANTKILPHGSSTDGCFVSEGNTMPLQGWVIARLASAFLAMWLPRSQMSPRCTTASFKAASFPTCDFLAARLSAARLSAARLSNARFQSASSKSRPLFRRSELIGTGELE